MNRRWLIAGGLGAMAGFAQAADVELFGIHTPTLGKWAVYARIVNNNGTAGISSLSIDVLNNTVAGVGAANVGTSAVVLPYGVSNYTDSVSWPSATEGVGYGFWVPGLRSNGDLSPGDGAHGISAAQYTTYDRSNPTVPYKDLLLTGIGITPGSASAGGNFKTSAGAWGYPIEVATGTYTPAGTSGTAAALGLKIAYSDFPSVNLLRFNSGTQDYSVEGASKQSVVDARTFTTGTARAGSTTVLASPGDANLDGAVNFDDLLLLANSYNGAGKTWFSGDFNYDGLVNFDDLLILAKNYNTAVPAAVPELGAALNGDLARAFAAVPEPSATGVLVGGLVALASRRRARKIS